MSGRRRAFVLRRACVLLCAAIALDPAPPSVAGQDGAPARRVSTAPAETRTLTVTVTDEKGRFVDALKADAFAVFDGGRPAEVVSFAAEDLPASVGIVLDASGSMRIGPNYSESPPAVRNALLRFLRNSHAAGEFSLLAFNRSPQLVLDRSNDPAAVLAALDRFGAAQVQGGTALYDTLYLAITRAAHDKHAKRAILVVTDGEDNASRYTYEEVRRALAESDVMVYVVGVYEYVHGRPAEASRFKLQTLSDLTGGRALFVSDADELYDAMEAIALELRYQYALGIRATGATGKDGWHEIKVRMREVRDGRGKTLKLKARARKGFYELARGH